MFWKDNKARRVVFICINRYHVVSRGYIIYQYPETVFLPYATFPALFDSEAIKLAVKVTKYRR
jgi:hypothetical protein